jgi:hypothetical protein
MARTKDPWAAPKDEKWIAVGKEIIPLPPDKTPFGEVDWVCSKLPTNPNPHDMPVFVINDIQVTGNGTRMIHFHVVGSPQKKAARWSIDIKNKWRPAPKPISDKPKKEKKVKAPPTRFEREDVI